MASLDQRDQEGKALTPCFVILSLYKLLLCLFFTQHWTLQLRPPGPGLIISLQLILFTAILLAEQSCQDPGSLGSPRWLFPCYLLFLLLHCSWGRWPGWVWAFIDRAYPVYGESAKGPHQIFPSFPSRNGSLWSVQGKIVFIRSWASFSWWWGHPVPENSPK